MWHTLVIIAYVGLQLYSVGLLGYITLFTEHCKISTQNKLFTTKTKIEPSQCRINIFWGPKHLAVYRCPICEQSEQKLCFGFYPQLWQSIWAKRERTFWRLPLKFVPFYYSFI